MNDSKCGLGSKRDRHENIGQGLIGMACFEALMNDPRLDGAPGTNSLLIAWEGFHHEVPRRAGGP